MRVLLSAIGFLPDSGSEGAYGWRACLAIAREHEVQVITAEQGREKLEQARKDGRLPDSLTIAYLGKKAKYSENRMIARLDDWRRYMIFARDSLALAKRLHKEKPFDLVQLVTFTTWRIACPLWRLNIPLIWGPISGTETFPWLLWRTLSPSALFFEGLRTMAGWWSWWNPEVRRCARKASLIPVTHPQAEEVLGRLRGTKEGIVPFVNVFFTEEQIAALRRPKNLPRKADQAPLKIFGSGNCEGRKGVAIALLALQILQKRGIPFEYLYSSFGPELGALRKKAKKLGLGKEVTLGRNLSRSEFTQVLRETDIYLLPSLREGAGQTMMEAMLAGCVPLVADRFGPAMIVTEECGWKVPTRSAEKMAQALAERLIFAHENREALEPMREKAQARIATEYSEKAFCQKINQLYGQALGKRWGWNLGRVWC